MTTKARERERERELFSHNKQKKGTQEDFFSY